MSFWDLFKLECRAIFGNLAIMLTIFGGVIVYSFLYPLPYTHQVPREQQVVVVNLDGSQMSRKLERMVDATPQVQLAERAYSIEEARQLFIDKQLAGIVVIPENFYRDLLLAKQPTLSFAGNAAYVLVYSTVMEGLLGASGTLSAEFKVSRMVVGGQAMALASKQYTAIGLNMRPTFNQIVGYVNYVVPAVFILILHQTLIIGAGLLGGEQHEKARSGHKGYWLKASPLKLLFVRTLLYVVMYWVLCMYYFGVSYEYYAVQHLANLAELNLLMLPFLLGAALLGISISMVIPRKEFATLIVLISSMPLVFGSGFVWPTEAVPAPLNMVLQFIPAVPAIKAFLELNQMGAEFSEILPLYKQMWICVGIYGVLGWLLLHRRRRLDGLSNSDIAQEPGQV